ncbi:MAG: hypothetical protein GY898_07715 [Proteobacteria bacterium]|nr:hypothetical protein [Pseudomonadota bacterium]
MARSGLARSRATTPLHVVARDTAHLRSIVMEGIAVRPDVARYRTHLVFEQWRKPALPCYAGDE